LLSLSGLLMFALLASPLVFAATESVQVTKLANPVTVDGKWTTPNEWSDTHRVSMYVVQGPTSTGYVRLKHDSNFLYLLVDFISDTTPAGKQTSSSGSHYDDLNIGIDKNVNDTNTECCDLSVNLTWENKKTAPNPVDPPWVQGSMSYNATNDPDSGTSHAIYEIAVPMPTFEMNSAIRISVWDQSRSVNMHWPNYQGSWSMKYFGGLVFSDIVVPEFSINVAAVLLVATVTVSLLLRKRTTCE
jgi:hypothetical protein